MAVALPDWRLISGGFDNGSSSGTPAVFAEVPIGTLDGSNTVFTLTFSPTNLPAIWLELNGVWQQPTATGATADYSIDGNTITYAVAPKSTDRHFIIYFIGAGSGRVPGLARNFPSGTAILDWGSHAAYRIAGDLSLGIWVRPKAITGADQVVIFEGDDLDSGSQFNDLYKIILVASGSLLDVGWNHENGSNTSNAHTFTAGLSLNQWYYIGTTRDATAKTVKLYVGQLGASAVTLVGTFNYANNADGGQDAGNHLVLGNGYPTATFVFGGDLQEHYIWSRTLTAAEHTAAMNGAPSATGMVLGCKMGNTPETDITPSGNTGTPTGTTLVTGH